MAKLMDDAAAGKVRFYLQFGGQGAPWYKELAAYYKTGELKKFFDVALGALEEEMPGLGGAIGLPLGLAARKWLDDESSLPPEEYLGCAAVSIPMIQITQLAHFENLHRQGFDRRKVIEFAKGATGHSQGLIPASLVAMGHADDAYYANMAQYVKYLLYLGVRAQEAYPYFDPTDDEIKASEALGGKTPTPMVASLGATHEEIQKLVDEVNTGLPASEKIYISLYNSPSNRILSSFRSSLIKFHAKIKDRVDSKELKYVYLRTTCPFHCPLMEGVRAPFEKDIQRLKFSYPGSALKIPVVSFFDGRNMQKDDEIAYKMYIDMAINPLYWEKSMTPVKNDASITHIIDLGPGKTSQRLSQDTLAEMGNETPVLAAGVPKDIKTLLA